MPLEHAKVFSPSASNTWLHCAGAPLAQQGVPNATSHAAEEGTAAHSGGERVLKDPDLNCTDLIGELVHVSPDDTGDETLDNKHWYLDAEMAAYTQEYVDYVRTLVTPGSELHVEVSSDFGQWVDPTALENNGKAWGTSDAVIVAPGVIHVCDLKYGQGIRVEAEGNSQALIYALGVYAIYDWLYDIKEVTVHIIQPRKGGVSSWTITVDELLAFGDTVRQATSLIAQENPQRVAGDKQCEWCRARKDCAEYSAYMIALVSEGFDETATDDSETLPIITQAARQSALDNDTLGRIVLNASAITKWLKESKEAAMERILAGETFTNIKPVKGRGSYSYVDEEKAGSSLVRLCGIEAVKPRKLITVAQAKKVKTKDGKLMADNKRWVSSHVKRNEGNIALAPINDKREAIEIVPLSDGFDEEPEVDVEVEVPGNNA